MDFLPANWMWIAALALVGLVVVGLFLKMVKLFLKVAIIAAVALAVVWAVEKYGTGVETTEESQGMEAPGMEAPGAP